MTIKCQICQKEFKSIITNSHLKSHGITTAQYKERYGPDSLSSPEYRAKRSKKYSGKNNPMHGKKHSTTTLNKISSNRKGKVGRTGKYSEEGLESIRQGIENREEKYRDGVIARSRNPHTEDTKQKISESVKKYANDNLEELKQRGKKAYVTALENNNWKPPMQRLKESDPSRYLDKCMQSKNSIKEANKQRSDKLKSKIQERIGVSSLTILDEFKSKVSNLWTFKLCCKNCETEFTFTRQYFTDSKFNGKICPTCYPRSNKTSAAENEVHDFILNNYSGTIIRNDRTLLEGNKEIDIYLPELSLAIEYNGLYWHSESVLTYNGREKISDYLKHKELESKGIRLLTIYEDEWLFNTDIVKSILKNKLGVLNNKIYARNCYVKEISVQEARDFLNNNHLQGYNKSKIKLGLFSGNDLISVMTFSNRNISRKGNAWEIDRFATRLNTIVIGGANKLWKHFIREYNVNEVISYADKRWSNGDVYKLLGFERDIDSQPGYWYFRPNELKRIHRYSLRKNSNDNPDLTEYENRKNEGYLRIWDCGNAKWIWKRKSP